VPYLCGFWSFAINYKVEMLKGDFSGSASVRIDKKNRTIFSAEDNKITVIQCGGPYDGI